MTLDGRELAAVFAGGFLGTAGRAELAELVVHDPGQWPVATFVANIVAAALLGYVTVRLRSDVSYRRPLLGAGLCGGLSTFATLQIELLDMLGGGHVALAVGYAAASLAAGFLALASVTTVVRRGRSAT